VSQYWDKEHLVSRLPANATAHRLFGITSLYTNRENFGINAPPERASSGVPVVRAIDKTRSEVQRLLQASVE